MPTIMSNSKEGQGHKDKCLDTSTKKILSREMLHVQYAKLLIIIILL